MKKRLISLSVVGLLFFALASGAQASAALDPLTGSSYHFTWVAEGAVDHVFAMTGDSIVPGTWEESWTINNSNLGTDWSITVTGPKTISRIAVWQKPDVADRVTFEFKYDTVTQVWSSENSSGPFLGEMDDFTVGGGTHTITFVADSDDGGAFAQFSATACSWNFEPLGVGDSDVDGLDLHAAIGSITPSNLQSFAEEFGRTTCP